MKPLQGKVKVRMIELKYSYSWSELVKVASRCPWRLGKSLSIGPMTCEPVLTVLSHSVELMGLIRAISDMMLDPFPRTLEKVELS